MTSERQIMQKIAQIVGYVPVGTLDLLHLLVHPEVVNLTAEYVNARADEAWLK